MDGRAPAFILVTEEKRMSRKSILTKGGRGETETLFVPQWFISIDALNLVTELLIYISPLLF